MAKAKGKGKVGRPFKKLDERQIKELASIGCTMEEMASVMGCNRDTLTDNYSAIIKDGRNEGNKSIRHAQQEVAVKDKNVSMLIWLGKTRLGQHEELNITSTTQPEVRKLLNFWERSKKTEDTAA